MDRIPRRYELGAPLARGGMAEVLHARELLPGGAERRVVVKRILPELAADPDFIEFFEQEARLALALKHPRIAEAFDFGTTDGVPFLVMEYVAGQPLLQVLRRAAWLGTRLGIGSALRIGADLAAALDHVHTARDERGRSLGIIHRDVSPHNVMVAYEGAAKLVDFGIARSRTQPFRTRAGVVKGKFAYLAPEMLAGRRFDHRVDLFGLGILLFEMLAGRHLFRADSERETAERVRAAVIPDLREVRPDCPPAVAAVVARALAREPSRRHSTAAALLAELEAAAAASGLPLASDALRDEMNALFPVAASRESEVVVLEDEDLLPVEEDRPMAAPCPAAAAPCPAATAPCPAATAPCPAPPASPPPASPPSASPPPEGRVIHDYALERFLRLAGLTAARPV